MATEHQITSRTVFGNQKIVIGFAEPTIGTTFGSNGAFHLHPQDIGLDHINYARVVNSPSSISFIPTGIMYYNPENGHITSRAFTNGLIQNVNVNSEAIKGQARVYFMVFGY